jgi:hypothetical protein
VEESYLSLTDLYAALVLTYVEYKTLPDSTHDRSNNDLTIDGFRDLTLDEQSLLMLLKRIHSQTGLAYPFNGLFAYVSQYQWIIFSLSWEAWCWWPKNPIFLIPIPLCDSNPFLAYLSQLIIINQVGDS